MRLAEGKNNEYLSYGWIKLKKNVLREKPVPKHCTIQVMSVCVANNNGFWIR
jgi:hypothetical protein